MALNPTPPPAGARGEKNPLKLQGLAFGQAFQTVFKVSAMYSVDHPAAGRSMQQSWDLLMPMMKNGGQFTFGFMNSRVLLNNTLVSHTNLTHLEVEFTKREIAAITFQSGVALKDYKRALALLTTRPMVIAERGGIKKFLAANPLEGVRVTPAAKPKEDGDTIEVGMDFESFLTAQALLGPEGTSGSSALDMLMDAAGSKKPQGGAASPRELVEVAERATRNTLSDPDGDVAELLVALTQMLSGLKTDFVIAALPPQKQADLQGQTPDVMSAHLMEDAIAGWAAEKLISASGQGGSGTGGSGSGNGGTGIGGGSGSGGSGTGGTGSGGEGVGSGGAEGTGGTGGEPGGGSRGNVEIEVLKALLRGLKATRVAERLMQKLAQFVEQANLPAEVYDRIHREVMWFTLPEEKKHAQLLSQGQATPQDFARTVQYVQEAMGEGKIAEASDIAQHYFAALDKVSPSTRAAELKRAPELLRALASVQTLELMHNIAGLLLNEILDETRLHWPTHMEATNCLAIVAQNSGRFEDFEFVQKIASDLKRSMARHPSQHSDCCGKALSGLLAPEALERLIESFLQKRSDAVWVRTATTLLTMIGAPGAEAALHRLDEETAASNRLPLIRLIRSLGASAIEPTRKRLSDSRWYVVRNAAYILGDLADPDLPRQLRIAARHDDPRVQQAAITAILKSNVPGRGEILAEALTHLQAGVLEMALDELTVLKDPSSVVHLQAVVLGGKEFKAGVLEKAVIALGAVPSDAAAEALYTIIWDAQQPMMVRRTALGGLYNHGSALARNWVAKLSGLPSSDPLAADLKKVA
jgi:HEAT repeat protein